MCFPRRRRSAVRSFNICKRFQILQKKSKQYCENLSFHKRLLDWEAHAKRRRNDGLRRFHSNLNKPFSGEGVAHDGQFVTFTFICTLLFVCLFVFQLEGQVVALMVQNMERLDETVKEEADGVHNALGTRRENR